MRIPFWERRKPIDFVGGLAAYQARLSSEIASSAISQIIAALGTVSDNNQGIATKGGSSRGYGTISGGAGYRGGNSPAAQAILKKAAQAKSAPSTSKSASAKKGKR